VFFPTGFWINDYFQKEIKIEVYSSENVEFQGLISQRIISVYAEPGKIITARAYKITDLGNLV
jgi:hypothetical protein